MTTDELKQYKKDYIDNLAELEKEHAINYELIEEIEKKQDRISDKVIKLIDDHEKVCEEFDRGK